MTRTVRVLQYRETADEPWFDFVTWSGRVCEEALSRFLTLVAEEPQLDVRLVDEAGVVLAESEGLR